MSKIKIIAVTYNHTTELEVFIGSLLLQTCPDWTCEVWHDGPAPLIVKGIMEKYSNDNRIKLRETAERSGFWGHVNRGIALDSLVGDSDDFILQTNADNYMTPGFVEQMLKAAKSREKVGIVFSNTVHSHLKWGLHKSELYEGGIDCGCCMVRLDIAKKVRFLWTHFSADGKYLEECAVEANKRGLCAIHIDRPLFVHN